MLWSSPHTVAFLDCAVSMLYDTPHFSLATAINRRVSWRKLRLLVARGKCLGARIDAASPVMRIGNVAWRGILINAIFLACTHTVSRSKHPTLRY